MKSKIRQMNQTINYSILNSYYTNLLSQMKGRINNHTHILIRLKFSFIHSYGWKCTQSQQSCIFLVFEANEIMHHSTERTRKTVQSRHPQNALRAKAAPFLRSEFRYFVCKFLASRNVCGF